MSEMTNRLPDLVRIHKAMGHPVRLRLLAMLRGGPLCVCQMTVVVKLAASTVSEHLSELRRAGLVAERKDGRWVEYRLSESEIGRAMLDALSPALEADGEAKADSLLVKELRRIGPDVLCGVGLDVAKIKDRQLSGAVEKAIRLRKGAAR